jgi:hypothetical protein
VLTPKLLCKTGSGPDVIFGAANSSRSGFWALDYDCAGRDVTAGYSGRSIAIMVLQSALKDHTSTRTTSP